MSDEHSGQLKALSFQQPYATLIATGRKTVECRTRNIKTPIKDLVICASKTASAYYPISGLVYGYAIGLVDVIGCEPYKKKHGQAAMMSGMPDKKSNAWLLENARLIRPFPVKATASFFYVEHEIEVIPTTQEAYLKHFADFAVVEDAELASLNVTNMFDEDPSYLWESYGL